MICHRRIKKKDNLSFTDATCATGIYTCHTYSIKDKQISVQTQKCEEKFTNTQKDRTHKDKYTQINTYTKKLIETDM